MWQGLLFEVFQGHFLIIRYVGSSVLVFLSLEGLSFCLVADTHIAVPMVWSGPMTNTGGALEMETQ